MSLTDCNVLHGFDCFYTFRIGFVGCMVCNMVVFVFIMFAIFDLCCFRIGFHCLDLLL